jgi:hypothetical protein
MGIEINAVKSFELLKNKNIKIDNLATLGRQFLYIKPKKFIKYIDKNRRKKYLDLKWLDNADGFFKVCGAKNIDSFDFSEYENANHIWDMNKSIIEEYKNKYDLLFDGGTLEHIFNFPIAIKNCMEMIKVGGHFLSITCANNFSGHGFYQFSPELFFRIFSKENGFENTEIYISENNIWYRVLDPNSVKSRVLFKNSQQTYIIIFSKKTKICEIFQSFPYQSDYVDLWKGTEHTTHRQLLKKILEKLSYLYKEIFIKYDKRFFKRIK